MFAPVRATGLFSSAVVAWAKDRWGVSAVEFALVLPVLALMFTGLIDFASLTYDSAQVSAAAHAGVQYAILNGYNAAAIDTAVDSATTLANMSATPSVTNYACITNSNTIVNEGSTTCSGNDTAGGTTAGTAVTVQAKAPFSPILPFWGSIMPTNLVANATVIISIP